MYEDRTVKTAEIVFKKGREMNLIRVFYVHECKITVEGLYNNSLHTK
jgi:hypothetical protein